MSTVATAPGTDSAGPGPDRSRAPRRRRRLTPLQLAGVALLALLFVSVMRVVTGENDLASSGALAAALGLAVPIGMAGLGGLWSERAGVVNIGLEGMMILGTWGAAFFAYHWGPWAGVVGAILLGVVGGAIHALATVVFGVDHIVSGVAVNLIGMGGAKYLAARTFTGTEGGGATQSPPLPPLPDITVPVLSPALTSLESRHIFFVSDVAGLLAAFITNLSVLTLIAAVLVAVSWWVLWRTTFGLRLRSCGENPWSAESLGVNVYLYKFLAVLISGGFAGLGGGYLALVAANMFRDGQTGGRGYIGLAAMIFGNWRPGPLAAGSLLFGYFDAVQLRGGAVHGMLLVLGVLLVALGGWQIVRRNLTGGIVALVVGGLAVWIFLATDQVPGELAGAAPYVATLMVLGLASQTLRMPAADGQVYRKGEVG
ncbi:ABC transporter permease [Arsenicicoccus sp. oral taxon 190]|uniref:ABC transporter permease n=1 Tax=Arsenicicoccus sp. oral taxon 190 TaxID=1658671 RepID=UPI00067A0C40|nr:ABC transporter permease [Arsenicicoccus sp. oral taxon 190]AKT52434.1 ABC transporter permease [Arsenicicoccus sp. oral taxon 190]